MRVITEPAIEPVSLEEAKSHLRVDIDDDNDLINSYLLAARQYAETFTRRVFITQTLEIVLDEFPDGKIVLESPPIQSIVAFTYLVSGDDEATDVDADTYRLDTYNGELALAPSESWPADTLETGGAISIQYKAGYGDDAADVPETIRTAINFLVAHWYEHREPVAVGTIAVNIPWTVENLLYAKKVVSA